MNSLMNFLLSTVRMMVLFSDVSSILLRVGKHNSPSKILYRGHCKEQVEIMKTKILRLVMYHTSKFPSAQGSETNDTEELFFHQREYFLQK